MSLHRSATQKGGVGVGVGVGGGTGPANEKKKDYSVVEQAMKELYPLEKQNVVPEIDIVLVPGLGANPEESWKSETTKFNWTTEALVKDFPKSRLLLYKYQSAWTGPLRVKQFMSNIAMTLLVSLQSVRKKCQRRPIVFIGHSMGGLVIAKAVVLADTRRDKFPIMFEAIAAAVFFGTPFGGAPVASVAAMYAFAAERMGTATSSKLLDLMRPGDEALRELKHEFMRLAGKISPRIELLCFWEEQFTDFSKMAGLPSLYGLAKLVIPKNLQEFVSAESAVLPGVDNYGLACDHRNLVKFDGHKDPRWSQLVRDHLKSLLHGAQLAVKNRLNSVRDIDRTMITNILDALEGAQIQKKLSMLRQTFAPSSWITAEAEYTQWLAEDLKEAEPEHVRPGDCLWVRGPEGRGKTSASMAAVEEIEALIRANEEKNSGQEPILLAYFFCDIDPDYNTAEDVLKSIVRQLIRQQETLAPYAKQFVKKKPNESGKAQAQLTVENLWQTLQDMLTDEFIGSKVVLILNNLHCLPEDSDSTIKLMRFLNAELQSMNTEDAKRVPVRWLITSRQAHNVEQALKVDGVRVVDLEDEKYGNQVQSALRKHARQKVSTLEQAKNYNKALAYFVSSLIGRRAQNTQWIDITCMQLEALPQTQSDLPVRRTLETMPQDLKSLLNKSWLRVFRSNEHEAEKIKEMLRALVLTYENPSEAELGILSGLCSDEERAELHELVEKCNPLLSMKRDEKISFMNVVVKTHLLENAKELLGLSDEEIKWQHGVLSLRAFAHLKERYGEAPAPAEEQHVEEGTVDEPAGEGATDSDHVADEDDQGDDEENDEQEENNDDGEEDGEEGDDDDDDEEESSEWDEEEDSDVDEDEDGQGTEEKSSPSVALPYMVKYWLRHASKATLEIAEDLSMETDFWKPDSYIRRCWLDDYCKETDTFQYFDHTTLTGLHVAAAVGFRQLVAALIRNSEFAKSEIKTRDSLANTPLHFAAHLGRPKIAEELLDRGAVIDDGEEEGDQTPLYMAALEGHVEVMRKLLVRGANPNCVAKDDGPVVNAAICSGNRAAVELLVERNASLTLDRDDVYSPLALAALLSDVSMFEYLIEQCAEKLPAVEYSKALVKAAEAGRVEVFNKLLEFHHDLAYFQEALDAAAEDYNWDITTIILQRQGGLDCNNLFYTVATGSEPQDKILEIVWEYADGSITPETLGRSLYDATDREKGTTVKLLLEKCGADPNATGEEYGNALTAAAYDGTLDIVRMLMDAGADVNAPEGYAIQAAAAEGHYEVVQELIQRGANVNALTTRESFLAGTALQGATEAGKTEMVELLLKAGADPNLGAGEDAPPIIAAARRAEEDILKLLLNAKPKLEVFGGWDKSTPLINAAAYMPVSSLKLLLDAGADINLADNDGDTALIVASRRGDQEAVEFLLNHGADVMHSSLREENALQAALEMENTDCLKVLVDHVSVMFVALKKSIDSGNPVVTGIIRSATNNNQGLNYDDEPETRAGTAAEPGGPTLKSDKEQDLQGKHEAQVAPRQGDHNDTNGINGHGDPDDADHAQEPAAVPSHNATDDNMGNGSKPDSYYDHKYRRTSFLESASTDQESEGTEHADGNVADRVVSMAFSAFNSKRLGNLTDDTDQAPHLKEDPAADDVDDARSEAATFGKVETEEQESNGDEALGSQEINTVSELSDELRAALGNQISLLQGFNPRAEEDDPSPDPVSSISRSQQESPVAGLSQLPSAPVELPVQGFADRYHQTSQSSPQAPEPPPKSQERVYQAYQQDDVGMQFGEQEQTTASSSHAQPQQASSSAYTGNGYGHSYHASQPSTSHVADYAPPHQQQYQVPSAYHGSEYGDQADPGPQNPPNPGRPQAYVPYHPGIFQQQQQTHVYTPEQLQAYHNHHQQDAYEDEKYQRYYASLQAAAAQQQQQEQQLQQLGMHHRRQESWGPSPPPLKAQRSSFFTGGVKSTLGKAKIVGNGFLNRK
ncbi:hypothetical protein F5Y17DRAFT_412009 [Xylariaceae sp. FL0594]|nr:hypothetical protein F5Y17DRAFT_412009 [Xylariaceae sp. FL0594]